ncbi:MAG: hypothetical protein AAFZ80_08885 [Cyanobacteria bacterium P01_A01_bin.105]
MTSLNGGSVSACGQCRFYSLTGRRGGECGQLGVPVKAGWTACCLAKSPFQAEASQALPPQRVSEVWQQAVKRAIAPLPIEVVPLTTSPAAQATTAITATIVD